MNKQTIVNGLVNYNGYKEIHAKKIVDAFVGILKQALKSGKHVEMEGLGTLVIVRRKQRRREECNLPNLGPTVVKSPRHEKTVKLSKGKDISYKEPKS